MDLVSEITFNIIYLSRLLDLPSYNSTSGIFANLNIILFGELLGKYAKNLKNILETSDKVMTRCLYLFASFSTSAWLMSLVS